jgi:uncharacterized protein YecT (DUF1311 family)
MMRLMIAVCLFPFGAVAQEVDCANATTQLEMNTCAGQDYQAADAALNETYAMAMREMKRTDGSLPKAERGAEAALRAAQRAWVDYRDAACDAEGYRAHGGSMESMVVAGCLARLTSERNDGLAILLEEQ